MIKRNLFLILVLLLALAFKSNPAFSEENNDSLEIQKVVNNYLDGFANQDLNFLMEQISPGYYSLRDGEAFDYEKIKSAQENFIKAFYKIHTNLRHWDVKITNLVISGDKATLDLEYKWKALNLDTSNDEEATRRRFLGLAKENGLWKIIQIKKISTNEEQGP